MWKDKGIVKKFGKVDRGVKEIMGLEGLRLLCANSFLRLFCIIVCGIIIIIIIITTYS